MAAFRTLELLLLIGNVFDLALDAIRNVLSRDQDG